jgi:hypothetical protein
MRESRRVPSSAALINRANDEGAVTFDPAGDRREAKALSNLPTARSPWGLRADGMDIAYLSTLSALAGSIVGGLTSGVATWLSQRAQARESRLAREMARRDGLYKEFIAAASKAYGEAIVSNEPNVQEFVALYAMISRMRLQSPPQTVACAEKIMRSTIDIYFAPSKTIRELHELAQSGSGIDLLKDFSEVAREELRAFTTL